MMTARDIASQAAEAIRELNDLTSDGADVASLDDARDVIANLEQMGQHLPQLCEQLARILVVQREEGQITPGPGQDPDFWVAEVVEALAAAGQAADMMAAALDPGPQDLGRAQVGGLSRLRLAARRPLSSNAGHAGMPHRHARARRS